MVGLLFVHFYSTFLYRWYRAHRRISRLWRNVVRDRKNTEEELNAVLGEIILSASASEILELVILYWDTLPPGGYEFCEAYLRIKLEEYAATIRTARQVVPDGDLPELQDLSELVARLQSLRRGNFDDSWRVNPPSHALIERVWHVKKEVEGVIALLPLLPATLRKETSESLRSLGVVPMKH